MMFFRNALLVLPAIFTLGSAVVLPISSSSTSLDAPLPARSGHCDSCGGPGTGVGTGISTTADVDVALRLFTKAHLDYASVVAGIFANVKTDLDVTVHTVISICSQLYGWSNEDLVVLSAALDLYISGTVTSSVDIFVKAGIEITSFTVVQATCLKAFIHTCIAANLQLTAEVKADIDLFVYNSIVVADCTVVSLQTKVKTCISALVSVVASLHLDIGVATCVSAAVSLKLAIKAYIQACIKTSTGLLALLVKIPLAALLIIVDAWISGDVGGITGTTATLLGINLKLVSDLTLCKSIISFLLRLSTSFNVVSTLKLDASVCFGIFSALALN